MHYIPNHLIDTLPMRIFSLLFLLAMFSSCDKKNTEVTIDSPIVPTVPNPPKPIKYLALGDSYTIGQSVEEYERYPIQLATQLEADSIPVDTTIIIAQTGWRTDNLINAIDNANLTDTFDLVSLLIGVNNQYQGKPFSLYETEFPELLQTAIDLAGGDKEKVFVLSIPDYGYTPFGQNNQTSISAALDIYNDYNKTITEAEGISWFDITPISRNGLAQPELVATDNLHPSSEMYRQWVELFYDDIKLKVE